MQQPTSENKEGKSRIDNNQGNIQQQQQHGNHNGAGAS
jgi:hypothetical protein